MKKKGLPGIGIILTGGVVSIVSYFIGNKFMFFFLIGIALFCYGSVKLFILRDKISEKFDKEEHHLRLAMHREKYPLLPVKVCSSCTTLLPVHANYCIHCGHKS